MPDEVSEQEQGRSKYFIKLSKEYPHQIVDCFLPKNRKCVGCKKSFVEDNKVYRIYCQECLNSLVNCEKCNVVLIESEIIKVGTHLLCQTCFEIEYFKCRDCGKMYEKKYQSDFRGVCVSCAKMYCNCDKCGEKFHLNRVKQVKDELYKEYKKLCETCHRSISKSVPQNIDIETNLFENINKIVLAKESKKLPVKKEKKVGAGRFTFKEEDYNIDYMVKYITDKNLTPTEDIYFYGLASRGHVIAINRDITEYQRAVCRNVGITPSIGSIAGEVQMKVGLSREMRENSMEWDKIIKFLNPYLVEII